MMISGKTQNNFFRLFPASEASNSTLIIHIIVLLNKYDGQILSRVLFS